MTEELSNFMLASTLIERAKFKLDIHRQNSELTDDEIAHMMRFLASGAPDTVWTDEGPTFMRLGIGIMLSLTLYTFPEFYTRYDLSQAN